jgi:hypothetical protein
MDAAFKDVEPLARTDKGELLRPTFQALGTGRPKIGADYIKRRISVSVQQNAARRSEPTS